MTGETMEFLYAIVLGIVQGLTEFLPVSSSGHLAVVGRYLELNQPGILFEVLLHAGTLLAVVWYLRDRILNLKSRDIGLIALGSIPAAMVGVLFESQINSLFSITKLVGVAFLFSAYLNFQTDRHAGKREELDSFDAIFIGIAQAVAIVPGISRSGSTIWAGSRMNLSKTRAAEFSFLLSIPAILGANFLEFFKHGGDGGFSLPLGIAGFVAAFLSGMLAIKILMALLVERRLRGFSYYLIVIGVITIFFL